MSDRAVLLARVSTHDQVEGFSLATQLDAGRQYAGERGYVVAVEFSEEFTGAELDRPVLRQIRDLAARREIDVLIVYDIDRLSRNMIHRAMLENELEQAGVRVEYVRGEFKDSPDGRFMKNIRAAVAEFEREQIRERSLRGKKATIEAGHVMMGQVSPYGYQYMPRNKSTRGHLVIDEAEAEIVRLMYHWYVYGDESGRRLGTIAIAMRLTKMGIPTKLANQGLNKPKRAATVWSKSSVSRILANEMYTGVWYYGRYQWVGGKGIPRARNEQKPVTIPAIIDRDLWETAQQVRAENRRMARRNLKHTYLMRGRLICATCGGTLYCYGATTKNHRYYHCKGQRLDYSLDYQTLMCKRSLRQDLIDTRVWEKVKQILLNPDLILTAMRRQQTEAEQDAATLRAQLAATDNRLASLEKQRSKLLWLMLETDTITDEMFRETMAALTQGKHNLEREAQDMRSRLSETIIADATIEQVQHYCERVRRGIEAFTFDDQVAAIDALKITGIVTRGATQADDVIVLSGYLPTESQEVGEFVSTKSISQTPRQVRPR